MLNLIVMSKQQKLLDSFFESLFPTIDNGVVIHVLSKGLEVPNDPRVNPIYMGEFKPGFYFNRVVKTHLRGVNALIGIVNDDIVFTDGWYEDVMKNVENHYFFSPGFYEGKDKDRFLQLVNETKDEKRLASGVLDAFYCFPTSVFEKVGMFDKDVVEWYDLDWLIRMIEQEYYPVTSRKVTIMHLSRQTLSDKSKFKNKVKQEILDKHGEKGLKIAKRYPVNIRKEFEHD